MTTRELPVLGQLKQAEKSLIWNLIHNTKEAIAVLDTLEAEDLSLLAAREVFEVAQSLKDTPVEGLPSTLLQRLSTVNAQLVTGIAATAFSPAPPLECVQALRRLRWDRERAALQREINRLQELGAADGAEIDALWQKKKDLLHRIEQLT